MMKILGNVDYLTKNKELCILLKSSTIKIGCYDEYIENLQMAIIVFVNFSYREKKKNFRRNCTECPIIYYINPTTNKGFRTSWFVGINIELSILALYSVEIVD